MSLVFFNSYIFSLKTVTFARIVDSGGTDIGYSVACDSSGNVYLAGECPAGPVYLLDENFNRIAIVSNLSSINSFVCKFDSSGNYQYSRTIDASSNDIGYSVACDSSGNVYFAGQYVGSGASIYAINSSNVVTTVGTLPNTISGGFAAFVCKFDSSGNYQYSRTIDASLSDIGYSVACDSSGNMYLAGSYAGSSASIYSINSSNVVTTVGTLPNTLSSTVAAFVCKFDSSGNYQYSRTIDASANDIGRSVACDSSGNMYLSGQYAGTGASIFAINSSNVVTTVGTLPNTLSSTVAAFVCKFDSSGNYQYSRTIDASIGTDIGRSVTCDSSGNMYLSGQYVGSGASIYAINSSNVVTTVGTLPSSLFSTFAAFVCKFDSSGNYQYSRTIDASLSDIGYSVTCDSSGNMYLAGSYASTSASIYSINSSNVVTTVGTLPNTLSSTTAAFVSKFDSSGNYQYSRTIDASSNDIGYSVACDSSGNVYFAGQYAGSSASIFAINSSNVVTTVGTLPAPFINGTAAFLIKFDSSGNYNPSLFTPSYVNFARIVDSGGTDIGYSVACDSSGNMYLAGQYVGIGANIFAINSSNVVTTVGTLPNTLSSTTAAFVSKFDSSGNYQYSRVIDASSNDNGFSVTCDSSGNMYLAGQYAGTGANIYSINSSNVVTTVGTLPNTLSSGVAVFVSKFDSSGNYQYSRVIDTSVGTDIGYSVACDSSGNMYLSGQYAGTGASIFAINSSNVVTTVGTLPNTISSTNAAFVCKFDSSGNYQYSRVIDASSSDIGYSVTCDSSGNMYLAGQYAGTGANIYSINSSNVVTTVGTLPNTLSSTVAAFVSKFDSSGNYQYSRVIDTSIGTDIGYSVACDSSGNMYLAGQYSGTTPSIFAINSSNVVTTVGTLPSSLFSTFAAFVSKFDSSGNYQYSRVIDASSNDIGYSVACDSSGNMYLTGQYIGSGANIFAINSSNVVTTVGTLPVSIGTSMFVSKFDSSGNYNFSRILYSSLTNIGYSVTCDSPGNMYLAGQYTNIATLIDQDGTKLGTLPQTSGPAAMMLKFDSSGKVFIPYTTFARIVDGTSTDVSQTVTSDSSGNVYFSGYYNGSASIKDQNGNTLGTLPASLGSSVAFVCKFNSSGVYQYSRTVDAASPGNDNAISVACDSSGNMYMAGVYNGTTATIYSINSSNVSTAVGTLPASSDWAPFVCKFDSSGTYQYTRIVDGNAVGTGGDGGQSVTCDNSGNIYLAGYYRGTIATIRAVNSSNVSTDVGTLPSVGGAAGFVSKFDSSGTYQYTRIIDSGGTDLIGCVACDSSGNMYVSGYCQFTPNIITVNSSNVSATVATLRPGSGGLTGFSCKFNSSGTYQYGITLDSGSTESAQSVVCDSLGNVYLSFQYSLTPTIYFNSSSNVATAVGTLPASSGSVDTALCKFDSSGVYQYSRTLGSVGSDVPSNNIGIDPSNNVYLGGYYTGTPSIYNVTSSNVSTFVTTLPASSNDAAFLLKFNSFGTYQYARIIDSVGVSEVSNSVACDSNGNAYFSGYYNGTPTIKDQNGTSIGTLPASLGSSVAFVCKFDPNGSYNP